MLLHATYIINHIIIRGLIEFRITFAKTFSVPVWSRSFCVHTITYIWRYAPSPLLFNKLVFKFKPLRVFTERFLKKKIMILCACVLVQVPSVSLILFTKSGVPTTGKTLEPKNGVDSNVRALKLMFKTFSKHISLHLWKVYIGEGLEWPVGYAGNTFIASLAAASKTFNL